MVELDNISFPKEFYEDEVRDGFYVSEMMKRFWGAQMVVLSEIEKVCKRHDIDSVSAPACDDFALSSEDFKDEDDDSWFPTAPSPSSTCTWRNAQGR